MGYYSIWPFLVGMVLLYGLAATPILKWADKPPSDVPGRAVSIDGLRGFLSLAVFFTHTTVYHELLGSGRWLAPPRFYVINAESAVALFFMITGYLFWSRLVQRAGKMKWASFYIGRIFRIGPLYLTAIAVMFAIAFSRTGLPLHLDYKALVRWLPLGLLLGGEVNGYHGTSVLLAQVTWTLQYEWAFYFALLPLAFFARANHLIWAVLFVAAGLGLSLIFGRPGACVALFSVGMLCGSLKARGWSPRLSPAVSSGVAIAVLIAVYAFCPTAFAVVPILLLGGVFFLITSGTTLFGLLTSRAAIRLGDVSFGIYLLQGLVLAVIVGGSGLGAATLKSPEHHWLIMTVTGGVLVLVATLAHVLIERPGIALGKRLIRRLDGGGPRAADAAA